VQSAPESKANVELVKLDATGGLPEVHSAQVDALGRIWITGNFNSINGVSCSGIARLHADGALDETLAPELEYLSYTASTSGLFADESGALYVYGSYRLPGELWPYALTELSADGPKQLEIAISSSEIEVRWPSGRIESTGSAKGTRTPVAKGVSPVYRPPWSRAQEFFQIPH